MGARRTILDTGRLAAAAVVLALAGCAAPRPGGAPDPGAAARELAPDVRVARIAPGLWVHTTFRDLPGWGPYPSNGMLLETEDGSVLVDTAWDDRQTEALLRWAAEELGRPVRRAVVTHAHDDRLGGMGALRRAGVRVEALGLTVRLAERDGVPAPDSLPGLGAAPHRDPAGFEVYYPGPGHAPDNVVVYFPGRRVLFGGCLVKPDTATTVGNVADADVDGWPRAVARVGAAYPRARVVVPGHGAVGGRAALRHTGRLVAARGPAAVEALRRRGGRE